MPVGQLDSEQVISHVCATIENQCGTVRGIGPAVREAVGPLLAERDRLLASRDELAIDLAKAYGDCDRLGEAIQTALRGVTDEDWEFVHATLREALDG